MLDHGFAEQYEKKTGKKGDFFTTHGDVFPVGTSKMTPFPPTSPNGSRSFPSKQLSKGVGEWNHYYVRAINGEVRLWVNGEEVSGGTDCEPRTGYLCLERGCVITRCSASQRYSALTRTPGLLLRGRRHRSAPTTTTCRISGSSTRQVEIGQLRPEMRFVRGLD